MYEIREQFTSKIYKQGWPQKFKMSHVATIFQCWHKWKEERNQVLCKRVQCSREFLIKSCLYLLVLRWGNEVRWVEAVDFIAAWAHSIFFSLIVIIIENSGFKPAATEKRLLLTCQKMQICNFCHVKNASSVCKDKTSKIPGLNQQLQKEAVIDVTEDANL